MSTRIKDNRQPSTGIKIKDMPDGTWFVTNLGLFVKAACNVCVDVATGKRAPFNEESEGSPVDVEIVIVCNARCD